MEKFNKTIVSTKIGDWTVTAVESTEKEGRIDFYVTKRATIHWVYACEGDINEVDETLLKSVLDGVESTLDIKDKAIALIELAQLDVIFEDAEKILQEDEL